MADQEISVTKKRGRPAKAPTGVVRLPLATLEAADDWAARQGGDIARPEAIRILVDRGLTVGK